MGSVAQIKAPAAVVATPVPAAAVVSAPNLNNEPKDITGNATTNSLQSSVSNSGSNNESSTSFSSRASSSTSDITTTKSTMTSSTATSQTTYTPSIIPKTYLTYLQNSGIETAGLDLNTVDTNSDLGRQLIALKQAYEIATGTSPNSNNNNSNSNNNSSSGSGGADADLATSYPGNDLSVAAALATLQDSLNNSQLMTSYFSKNPGSAYTLNDFKAAAMGNSLGTYVFNLNTNSQAMGCTGGGTACGASGTLESQIVTINYATANISNSYRITYSLDSTLSGSVTGSGSSTFANLTGSGKSITLPVNNSHPMLKMLGTFAPVSGNDQYANFKAAIALANPSSPGANVTISTPNPYVINGIKQ
jgi:hypothetical protein